MQLTVEAHGNAVVVTLDEETLDAGTAASFKHDMQEHVAPDARVILDLHPVRFVDSAGLGAILSCLRRLQDVGGELKLCGLNDLVRSLFELVRLHRVVDIVATREDAARAFAE